MKIAIIGCGYVGMAVARYFYSQPGSVVTATTTTPERVPILEKIAHQVIIVKGSDTVGLKSVLQDQDVILMCVGARGKSYQDTYLHTARNLVGLMRQIPSVKQIIYTSSYGIYGNQQGRLVDESSPLAPATANQQILVDTEQILLSATSAQRHVCIFRLGGIYGPLRELVKIYSRVAGQTLPGDGYEPSNWIHLDDIVGAIAFASEQQLQGIYNLVDDSQLQRRELIAQVLAKHNLNPVTWDVSQSSSRPYNIRVSNQKIQQAGYQLIQPSIIV